jgi:SAM-dependent methyltransferase
MSPEELEALHGTMHRLERRWNLLPIPDNSVYHAYDPLPFWQFFEGIRIASAHTQGRRFLDLGCGIGTKLALMHGLGWEVSGIEQHLPYVEAARELIPEANVIHGQIEDLEDLEADLVYMYRPAVSEDLELELEHHVAEILSPGSVLFLPVRDGSTLGLEKLGPEIWRI